MGPFALAAAVVALCASVLPYPGMFVAMAAGILAAGTGTVAWRRRGAPGPTRLAGAAGLGLATLALLVAVARYGLTLAAVARLAALVG
ncbi:MAG TPA: hypothetical protein VM734_06555 [Kofleriaceae bacterium]|nr:hypothetical protein [Kofleriaceae bacterium]